MLYIIFIQNQSTVLDPMCGKATILLETAKNLEVIFQYSVDFLWLSSSKKSSTDDLVQNFVEILTPFLDSLLITSSTYDPVSIVECVLYWLWWKHWSTENSCRKL